MHDIKTARLRIRRLLQNTIRSWQISRFEQGRDSRQIRDSPYLRVSRWQIEKATSPNLTAAGPLTSFCGVALWWPWVMQLSLCMTSWTQLLPQHEFEWPRSEYFACLTRIQIFDAASTPPLFWFHFFVDNWLDQQAQNTFHCILIKTTA